MSWGKDQINKQALLTAREDYAAFEALNLAEREDLRVLDVGCFDGFNTYLKFSPYDSIVRVVGIDPEAEALDVAASRTDDARFTFLCTTFESFEAGENEQFDLVYFSHTLQHVRDQEAALSKAYRLLAPGGFVIVKTVDDAAKLSYPDPENVMQRLSEQYERYVLPYTAHTATTDRYSGQKCYTFMKQAGFENVRVRTFTSDTAGKTLEQRQALFERCVYFRRVVPSCVGEEAAKSISDLVQAWGDLFEREDYYFSTASFVILGQKPLRDEAPWQYRGPYFGEEPPAACRRFSATAKTGMADEVELRPLVEGDLGAVMDIEIASFRDPWTPLAFALDLRHNPRAHYTAAFVRGVLVGYLGWWDTPQGAVIVRVAVDPRRRGAGVGRSLVEDASRESRGAGSEVLMLEVRASNAGARSFYQRLHFQEDAIRTNYYDDPPDDAIVMTRSLCS